MTAAVLYDAFESRSIYDEALFEKIAQSLFETGYCVVPNGLPEKALRALQMCLQITHESVFESAGVGRQSQFQQDENVRSDEICWIDGSSPEGQQWLGWCEALRVHLNRRLFLGLFSVESHIARYQAGAFYKRHVDAFRGQRSRMISMVTYLNDNWQLEDGGELVLYKDDNDGEGVKVLPCRGTLVLFLSEQFPHEVLPANRERISVATWFRVNGTTSEVIDPPK